MSGDPILVFVTGATGFVGRATVATLLEAGHRVRALVRPGARPLAPHPALETTPGDMRDATSLTAGMAGADVVVHLAAAKADEPQSEAVNVDGARHLVAAMRAQEVGGLVNLSTQSVLLRRRGRYGLTKAQAEDVLWASGVPLTNLRASLVYGDLESGVFGTLSRLARLPVVPVLGDGRARYWPIHVDDLARALEIAVRDEALRGKSYDVGGPDAVSMDELVAAVQELTGSSGPTVHLPLRPCLLAARALSVLPRPPLTRSNVLGAEENVPMAVERFFADFGFQPRGFREGLAALGHA